MRKINLDFEYDSVIERFRKRRFELERDNCNLPSSFVVSNAVLETLYSRACYIKLRPAKHYIPVT